MNNNPHTLARIASLWALCYACGATAMAQCNADPNTGTDPCTGSEASLSQPGCVAQGGCTATVISNPISCKGSPWFEDGCVTTTNLVIQLITTYHGNCAWDGYSCGCSDTQVI